MPIINRLPINADNDDDYYESLVDRQIKDDKNYDTLKNYNSIPTGLTVVVPREGGGPQTHGAVVEKVIPTTMTGHTRYGKDRMADHQRQQTCEGSTNHS